jgi:DNA-binding NarL/FixJ family response regulator
MMPDVQILLADDHFMVLKGLRKFLEYEFNFKDIVSATSCNEIMKQLKSRRFTHLILDLGLSDGNSLEILPTIRILYPTLRILVFTMQPREVYGDVLRKKYGVLHYVPKSASEEDTFDGIARFFENDLSGTEEHPELPKNPFSDLSVRELEVLPYLLQNKGITEIAGSLGLQRSTVSTLKSRIFEKTSTGNIFELKELSALYNIRY